MVPLITLIVLQHLEERDNRKNAGISDASAAAQGMAGAMDRFATDVDSFTAAAAIRLGDQESINQANTGAYLRTLSARYPNLTALFMTDADGRVIAQSADGDNTGFDVSTRPYIRELKSGKDTVWTGGFQGLQSGEVLGTFGRSVYFPDGGVRGYLIAAFRPSNISASLPADFPGDANIILIDQNGQLIYSRLDPTQLKTGESLADVPSVQRVLSGELVRLDGDEGLFEQGERFGAYAAVPRMGWAVGYTRSSDVLASSLRDDLLKDLGILALIMTVVIAAMLLIARQMTRPLKRLALAAREVTEGHQVAFTPSANTDREVAALQNAFTTMSAAVREREERLTEQAERLRHLEEAGAAISAGLDFEATVQAVTDEGTRLLAAEYGAFLSSTLDHSTEAQHIQTFSEYSYPAFDDLRNTTNSEIWLPMFRGDGPLRISDLAADGRAAESDLLRSNGHLPLRSLLAVPVISGSGTILGGLFFGHSEANKFTQRDEEIARRLATWASIALDNSRLYAQAKVIEEELRRANFAKDEFLGLISHELRTPVTTIYGGLRILHTHRELLEGDQAAELIESMADEGVRLVRLIEDLLALTRVELGRQIDTTPMATNELVQDAVDSFAKLRPVRPVSVALADGLPLIEVEPTYFRQILTNLLSNADKYSPAGLPVVVETALDGVDVSVEVTDGGDGVAPGEEDKIFDTFFRSEKTAAKAPGQGLGLTVCRKLVEAQGGKIWARNNPGRGFSVGFSFPALGLVEEDSVAEDRAVRASRADS
jgi:signal transduction histidine kinase